MPDVHLSDDSRELQRNPLEGGFWVPNAKDANYATSGGRAHQFLRRLQNGGTAHTLVEKVKIDRVR